MTRARNIAGFSTITTTPSPVHVGPIGVLTATRIDGEFNVVDITSRDLTAQGIGVTNLQVSGITTGLNVSGVATFANGVDIQGSTSLSGDLTNLNVSGIITAQNGINFNGTSTGLNASGISTIATLDVNGNADVSGNLTVGGVLTYEDVTNVDSVGVVTARGLSIFGNTTGLNATGVSTFTGNVSIADKIIHTGDTNTAIRFPAADTVSIETVGSEALRVDSSQRLVVGATSSNNVGGFGGAAFQVEGLTAGTSALSLIRHSANTVGSTILMGKTRGTSDAAVTIVQDDDNVARIIAYGADGTDTESSLGAIQFDVDGTPGANDMPGRIVFSTTPDGASTYTERMRITSAGKVSIGNLASPDGNLHVYSSSAGSVTAAGDANELVLESATNVGMSLLTANDSIARIKFGDPDNTNAGVISYTHSTNIMGFHTNDGTERIRITSDGVVCIGNQNKTWATAYKVFQVGAAALSGQVEGDGTTTNWTNNCYFDSGNSRWEYSGSASDQASRISMADGKTILSTAAAGTADNALTFSESLRIDDYGRVLIGETSAIIASSAEFSEIVLGGKTRGAGITLQDEDANTRFQIRTDDAGGDPMTLMNASTNHPIAIRTNNVERVRITNDGITIKNAGAGGGLAINALGSSSEYGLMLANANRSGENDLLLGVGASWNGDSVAQIDFRAGSDTSNKDNGRISFSTQTSNGGGLEERMVVNEDGFVTKPDHPYFHAYGSPSNTNFSNYDNSVHSFGNIQTNNGSHYNNSTGRFTAPVNGFYWFSAGLWSANSDQSTGQYLMVFALQNSDGSGEVQFTGCNHRYEGVQLTMSAGAYMTKGQTMRIWHNGSINNSTPRNYFSGYLVG